MMMVLKSYYKDFEEVPRLQVQVVPVLTVTEREHAPYDVTPSR